jgi:cyclophilin family peptidyl-prolyl cis-trans isomerase
MQLLRPTLAALAAAAVISSSGPQVAGLRPTPAFAEQGTRGAIDAQGRAPAVAAAQDSPSAIDLRVATPRVTSRVFLDVGIGNAPAGRLVIDLFGEACPRAAENFRALCTGENGYGYAGSGFYRVVQGLTVQGGEIAGSPQTFPHDNYRILHNLPGVVSMVNTGVGGGSGLSDSRFLIQVGEQSEGVQACMSEQEEVSTRGVQGVAGRLGMRGGERGGRRRLGGGKAKHASQGVGGDAEHLCLIWPGHTSQVSRSARWSTKWRH